MSVPKLRFKEFDGNWSKTSFQDLFIFKNGVNASKEQYGSGVKFINVLDIINNPNGITYNSIIGSVDINSKEIDKNLVKYGDVLFQRSSETREEVGQSNVYLGEDPVVFGGFVIRGSAQIEYDPIFMNGLLKTDSLRDQITQLSGGSTRFNIGQDSLNKVFAYLPSKIEQTKIAFFLSAVDEKISQLTQKHELLSQYKQGMMQKLFSQQIRFKADDGSEFGEWEETTLGKIAKNISAGATPSTLKEEYWGGHIRWMSSGELNYKYVYDVEKTITELGFKSSSTKLLPKYCVLIGLAGQGKTRGTVAINYIELCTNQSIAAIHPNPKVFDHRFIFFNLDMRYQELRGLSTGDGGRGGLNLQIIRGVELELPCLEEQTQIANFLSAIDQKIEVVAQQIEQAKQWKKALLQQMFV